MRKARTFSRNSNSYRRDTHKNPSTGHTFLIVTEGEKTEPHYLKTLSERLRLSADVDIVHRKDNDPLSLTQRAIKLRNQRKKDTKEGLKVEYDEVWVVFDLEDKFSSNRKKAIEAMALRDAGGIRFAYSNPSFEYWLLLHEEYTTAQFANSAEVENRLKTQSNFHNYRKGSWFPSKDFLEKIPTAVKNSKKCWEYHKSSSGDENPSTKMDILVHNLNDATRPYLQFQLRDVLLEAKNK